MGSVIEIMIIAAVFVVQQISFDKMVFEKCVSIDLLFNIEH